MDGYPDMSGKAIDRVHLREANDESSFRELVRQLVLELRHGTIPEQGWPWPWENSRGTDFSYAWDEGQIWVSCFGHGWVDLEAATDPPKDADGESVDLWDTDDKVDFPDMMSKQNVALGSGLLDCTPRLRSASEGTRTMGTVNKVILLGNLGQDPDLRKTKAGKAVCNLRIATTDRWVDSHGEQHERTSWHDVVAWDRQAEACGKHLSKGSQVYIEGRLQTRRWEDRDGNTRYTTEVQATQVTFLGGGEPQKSKLADSYEPEPQQQTPDADEIPW